MRIVFWGTYDIGKPRNRILLRGLRENGIDPIECHYHVWEGVEDKSDLKSKKTRFRFLLRWLAAYPVLVFRYLMLPKHDVVVVGYLGQLDVLVLWMFAKLRGATIVWDAFLSIHDTVVYDRKLCPPNSLRARLIYRWEWLACRAAAKVILDTDAHAAFFCHHYSLEAKRVGSVFVGVEPDCFPPVKRKTKEGKGKELSLVFYGQCIPLHGIPTIIEAASLLKKEDVSFTIIGSGQELERIQKMVKSRALDSVRLIPWIEYQTLCKLIEEADVCLGIFGDSGKAGRVIPNKVFQVIQSERPLVTRDSEAIRELLSPDTPGVLLVPPASPDKLAEAILEMKKTSGQLLNSRLYEHVKKKIQPHAIGRKFLSLL